MPRNTAPRDDFNEMSTDTEADTEAAIRAEAEAKAKADAEAEAKAKADAEAEAKAKADAEAATHNRQHRRATMSKNIVPFTRTEADKIWKDLDDEERKLIRADKRLFAGLRVALGLVGATGFFEPGKRVTPRLIATYLCQQGVAKKALMDGYGITDQEANSASPF